MTNLKSKNKISQQRIIYRSPQQTAIHYSESNITELWNVTKGDRLHLIRLFEEYRRGVEYQPAEIKGSHSWDQKNQVVAPDLVRRMKKTGELGEPCERIETRILEENEIKYELEWIAMYRLPKRFSVESEMEEVVWELISTNKNTENISSKFSEWNHYHTTDYTDIGDNESDPFLLRMINLGFIEHRNTGFYDSDGNVLPGSHHH